MYTNMLTNYIAKPFMYKVLLTSMLATFMSLFIALFLPNNTFEGIALSSNKAEVNFSIAKSFNLKQEQKTTKKVPTKKENAGMYLLKDFVLNTIFINGTKSLVIAKNTKSGVFLHLHDSYMGYELVEIHQKKAKFKKGINFYWSFLNPKDEKNFREDVGTSVKTIEGSAVRETVANEMFEEIKYKNGIYYIPKQMLSNNASMMQHLSSIGAQIYNISGAILFKITYITSASVFYKIGIRKNDFIIAANGKAFKSPKEPLEFFKNIKNVKSLSITVKRSNQTKELSYEIY